MAGLRVFRDMDPEEAATRRESAARTVNDTLAGRSRPSGPAVLSASAKKAQEEPTPWSAWSGHLAERSQPGPQGRLAVPETRALTQQEFDALSTLQQAGVLFNTGAVRAAQEDVGAGRWNDPTSLGTYLDELGLDRSLGLTSVATDELLGLFDNQQSQQDAASSLRWAHGDREAAGTAQRLSDALQAANATAQSMAAKLSQGQTTLAAGTPTSQRGFGIGVEDELVQYAFNNLADANQAVTLQDVADFLADANADSGTNVTLQDVFSFADLRLKATEYDSLRNPNGGDIMLALDPSITAKPAEQLRRELGL